MSPWAGGDVKGQPVDRAIVQVSASSAMVEKGEYRHFMEKEIHEQPDSVQHTLSEYLDLVTGRAKPQGVNFAEIDRIQIVACGTAAEVLAVDHPFVQNFFASKRAAAAIREEVA